MSFTEQEEQSPEPSTQSIMDQAMSEGWDFFDHPADQAESARYRKTHEQRGREVAQLAAQLWNAREFRLVVEWLLDVSVRRGVWVGRLGLAMDQAYGYGMFREGQNALAMTLMRLIAEGQKVKPQRSREG
jgi:hypothetical protein